NHGDAAGVDIRQGAQIGYDGVHVLQYLRVAQLHTRVTACQRVPVTRETPEEVWDQRHIASLDQLVRQVRGALDNAVAFVEMDDGGTLIRPTGAPEKTVYPVVDAHLCQHAMPP